MSDARFTWEAIQPLIGRKNNEGRSVVVSFRDPDGAGAVSSRAFLQSADEGRFQADVQRHAAAALQNRMAQEVAYALGGGLAGMLGRQVMQGMARSVTPTKRDRIYTEADEQRAVVEAFRLVSDHFTWEGGRWRWAKAVAAEEAAEAGVHPGRVAAPDDPFHAALAPLASASAGDRALVARLLAELVLADGGLGDRERALLDALGDAGVDDPAALAGRGPLDQATLGVLGGAVWEAALLLALSVAWADGALHPREAERLGVWRGWLGVSEARYTALEKLAKGHVVGELYALAWRGGRMDLVARNEARKVGMRLGLDAAALDALDKAGRARG